jgi:arylsulfatase A-like enzyme/Flp pilus assembly protein TadD
MRRLFACGLFLVFAFACSRERSEEVQTYAKAPVIIISIDTLRADHLPMFGYRAVETPNLDALRRDGVLFSTAYSHVPLTLPSHTSILTGLLPPHNGVRNNLGYVLDPKIETIASFLRRHGYVCGAAVSAFVLRGSSGLAHSFDFYDDAIANRPGVAAGALQRSGRLTEEIARRWIAERTSRRFFLLLHLFEPHAPYEPEEPFKSKFANAYDGEIATADSIVGEFLRDLKQRGIYDQAIIVMLSDHGEGLNQHGEPEHGIFVYREDIHVPLIVKLPGSAMAGNTISAPVGLVDVFPTIAQLLGFPAPPRLDGRSLFESRTAARSIYSESLYPRIHLGWSELRSLANAQKHLIQAPTPELYNIERDPRERTNTLSDDRRTYAQMRDELTRYTDQAVLPSHIDPEEAKKLAALGYLSAPAATGSGELPDPKDRIGEISDMIRATRLLSEHRNDEAIAAFRAIVAKNPRFTDAWNELGSALEAAGRNEEASAVYKRAIETTPELAGEFGLRRAAVLLRLEQYGEAERHARLGERSNPGGAHLMLSRIALAQKNYAAAEGEARAAMADANDHAAAEVLLAQVLAQQGRVQDALPVIEQAGNEIAQEKLGNIESYHFARGDILARMNRYDEAIAEFKQEIATFPLNRQPYANLYLVYMVRNERAQAQQTLEQMARAIPGRTTMLFAAKTAAALGDARSETEWRRKAADSR